MICWWETLSYKNHFKLSHIVNVRNFERVFKNTSSCFQGPKSINIWTNIWMNQQKRNKWTNAYTHQETIKIIHVIQQKLKTPISRQRCANWPNPDSIFKGLRVITSPTCNRQRQLKPKWMSEISTRVLPLLKPALGKLLMWKRG